MSCSDVFMGPVLLCDKSTLQTLSNVAPDLLHHYFSLNVPPILVREILGDLTHPTPKDSIGLVRSLAKKLAHLSILPNADFRGLLFAEMSGKAVKFGRPILAKGTEVRAANGEIGILADDDPCEMALHQWRLGNFTDFECEASHAWREMKGQINWRSALEKLKSWYLRSPTHKRCFDEVLDFVDDSMTAFPTEGLKWFLEEFRIPHKAVNVSAGILNRLPYAHFCIRLALTAVWAMESKLLYSKDDNFLDLEYLFYLPFCTVFTSRDRFQRKLAPLFLSQSQEFVNSEQFESDLSRLAKQMLEMSDDERKDELAMRGPPYDETSICYRIWKRFMRPGYREHPKLQLTPENEKRLVDHVKMLVSGQANGTSEIPPGESPSFHFRKRYMNVGDMCACGSNRPYQYCHGRRIGP